MNDDIRAIFTDTVLGTLATVNADGSPWATALHVVADDEAVYWFSSEMVQHSQNIVRDGRASLSVFSPDESQGPTGVYLNGSVETLDDAGRSAAYVLAERRIGTLPPSFAAATGYRLRFGDLDTQKSRGRCWYFYS
jgi:nitroimidazol reductase NimA-like FMN-containing flavoprotein (pyridoxamine 5'-phosphate oxidase superfamily)